MGSLSLSLIFFCWWRSILNIETTIETLFTSFYIPVMFNNTFQTTIEYSPFFWFLFWWPVYFYPHFSRAHIMPLKLASLSFLYNTVWCWAWPRPRRTPTWKTRPLRRVRPTWWSTTSAAVVPWPVSVKRCNSVKRRASVKRCARTKSFRFTRCRRGVRPSLAYKNNLRTRMTC